LNTSPNHRNTVSHTRWTHTTTPRTCGHSSKSKFSARPRGNLLRSVMPTGKHDCGITFELRCPAMNDVSLGIHLSMRNRSRETGQYGYAFPRLNLGLWTIGLIYIFPIPFVTFMVRRSLCYRCHIYVQRMCV